MRSHAGRPLPRWSGRAAVMLLLLMMVAAACSGTQGAVEVGTQTEGADTDTESVQTEEAQTADRAVPGDTVLRLPGQPVGFPSPFAYLGGIGYAQTSFIYDTLLWKNEDGEYIPWLAERWERSDDGTTYTVTLRDDVTWHDGEPLTAADVAFTFDYLRTNAEQIAPSVITRLPAALERVRADDDVTVTVEMSEPDWTVEQFAMASSMFIMPEHIWGDVDDPGQARDPELLVGSGPYVVEELALDTGANRYVANPEYALGAPAVGEITFRPVDDQLSALEAGELDQAGGVGPGAALPPAAVDAFEAQTDRFEVFDATGATVTALYFNVEGDGPLADVQVRTAAAHAVDRQRLIEQLFGGRGAVASPGILPPDHPMYVEVDDPEHDPQRAEALLDEAGYTRGDDGIRQGPDGERLSFELLVSDQQATPPVELVVTDLEAVGFEITTVSVDLPTFHQRRNAEDTELSINTFGGTNTDEQPDGLGKVYLSTTPALQRAQGYSNPQFDELHARQRRTLDEQERADIAAEMQRLVAEELPVLPLFHPPLTTVVSTERFDGWYQTPGGVGGLVPSVNDKRAFLLGDRTDG